MAKINWEKLEIEYITNKTSYSKLAKKHNISVSSIEKYAIKNNWVKKRRNYCSEVKAKTLARASARDIDRLIKVKESTEKMAQVVNDVFDDKKQFRRQIVMTTDNDGNMQQKEKLMKKYDTKAIRDMTAAMKDLTSSIRDLFELYPEPVRQKIEAEQLKMDIEVEKLQIMKDKQYQTDEEHDEYGVVEISPVQNAPEEENANE